MTKKLLFTVQIYLLSLMIGFTQDIIYSLKAEIEMASIPSEIKEECVDIFDIRIADPVAYQATKRILSQLVNRESYSFSMENDDKGKWIIQWTVQQVWCNAQPCVRVYIESYSQTLVSLINENFSLYPSYDCLKWSSDLQFEQRIDHPRSYSYDEVIVQNGYFKLPTDLPSAQYRLPGNIFANATTVGHVDDIISRALLQTGFKEKGGAVPGYYQIDYKYKESVDNGYVYITRMEQFYSNGSSVTGERRWLKNIDIFGPPSIKNYLKALIFAPKGHYRVFAFVVFPGEIIPGRSTEPIPTIYDQLKAAQKNGESKLDPDIAAKSYANRTINTSYVHAYIYEFECVDNQEEVRFIDQNKTKFKLNAHLLKSGIWQALQRP